MRRYSPRREHAAGEECGEPAVRLSIGVLAWRCFLEARPTVQGAFLLRLASGWALTTTATGWTGPGPVVALVTGSLGWCCVVMAIYLLNGVSDVSEDLVNESRRPIAAGRLPVRTAVRGVWLLAVAGVLAGFATAAPLGMLAVLALGVGWLYSVPSWRLKRRSPGTAAAALAGIVLTYYAGAVIATAQDAARLGSAVPAWPGGWRWPMVSTELLVFAGALSLWAALVGGTTKDLPDLAGDRAAGTRSWAVVWDERRFRAVVSVIALSVGGGSAAVAAGLVPGLLPPAATLCAGAAVVAGLLLAPAPPARRDRRAPYRAFMATQYVAHAVLLADRVTAMVSS
jgi:4-hydroxybenzoate polyprenyltransferase